MINEFNIEKISLSQKSKDQNNLHNYNGNDSNDSDIATIPSSKTSNIANIIKESNSKIKNNDKIIINHPDIENANTKYTDASSINILFICRLQKRIKQYLKELNLKKYNNKESLAYSVKANIKSKTLFESGLKNTKNYKNSKVSYKSIYNSTNSIYNEDFLKYDIKKSNSIINITKNSINNFSKETFTKEFDKNYMFVNEFSINQSIISSNNNLSVDVNKYNESNFSLGRTNSKFCKANIETYQANSQMTIID